LQDGFELEGEKNISQQPQKAGRIFDTGNSKQGGAMASENNPEMLRVSPLRGLAEKEIRESRELEQTMKNEIEEGVRERVSRAPGLAGAKGD